MPNSTDQISSGAPGVTDEHRSKAAEALALAAVQLVTVRPDEVLTDEMDFAVLLGAKVYDVGGRSGSGGGVRISRLALDAVGEVPAGVKRAAFARPADSGAAP